jgi:hypothetical protein
MGDAGPFGLRHMKRFDGDIGCNGWDCYMGWCREPWDLYQV